MDPSPSPNSPAHAYTIPEQAWRVRDIPQRLRPREEMARVGVRNVSDDVLLAVLLRSGVRGTNVISLARRLLQAYGSLRELANAPAEELAREDGMGPVKAQVLLAALETGRRLSQELTPERCRVRTPADAARVLMSDVRQLDAEVFWILCLDAKNQLIGTPIEVTRGLLDASLVHPREVFRAAIRRAAAAIVLAHNHPSGDLAPSAEDLRITRQLCEAGRVIDIRVLDHVIVGRPCTGKKGFLSLREEGMLSFES